MTNVCVLLRKASTWMGAQRMARATVVPGVKCQRSMAPWENKIKEKSEGYYGVKVKGVPEYVSARQTLLRGE